MNPQGSKWLGRLTRARIYVRDGRRCVACGRGVVGACSVHRNPLTRCQGLSLDHVVSPLAGGARRDPRNLVTLCCGCNSDRRSKPLAAWRPELVSVVRRHTRRAVSFARAHLESKRLQEAAELARELWPAWFDRERSRIRKAGGDALSFDFGYSERNAA